MTHTIRLPWPTAALWPNRKAHWAEVHRSRTKASHDAYVLCMAQRDLPLAPASVAIDLTFCRPTTTSRFDLDNALAAMKGSLDGIASALGVDDSRFSIRIAKGEPVKGGEVVVAIREAA